MSSGVEISKRLFVVNSASTVAARALSVVIQLWMHQYLLRRISVEEYAIYPVVMAAVFVAPVVKNLLTTGVARYVVAAFSVGDQRRVTQVVSSMYPILVGGVLLFAATGALATWRVEDILEVPPGRIEDAQLMLGLLVGSIALEILLLPFCMGLYMNQRFIQLNLLQVGKELLRIALLFILLFGVSTRVLWVVVAATSSNVAATVVLLIMSRRLVPALRFEWGEVRRETAKELLTYGGWATLYNLAYWIQTGANTLILNKLGTPVDVAAYHVGSLPHRQIDSVSRMAVTPVLPALIAMHSTGDTPKLRYAYLAGGRVFLWLTLAAACPLIAFAPEVVELYVGVQYLSGATVLALLLGTYPAVYACDMAVRLAIASANLRGIGIATFVAQIASIAAAVYLVGWLEMGAVGAALATFVTTNVTCFLVYWPLGMRLADVSFAKFARRTLMPGLLPFSLALPACLALRALAAPTTWWTVGGYTAAGLVVYFGILFAGCLQERDRYDLHRVLAKLRLRAAPTGPVPPSAE